jgi:ferric-dicitrate binding protein FerR (iron transport regulator)
VTSAENENSFKEIFFSLLEDTEEKDIRTGKVDFNRIYSKVLSEINTAGKNHERGNKSFCKSWSGKMILRSVGIAAALVVTFFLGSIFNGIIRSDTGDQTSVFSFTEIKTPYGSTSQISLPDGSQVLLNAGSSIKYKNDFNKSNRDLILSGEAYFRVSKNIDLPLNVIAGNINIRAMARSSI